MPRPSRRATLRTPPSRMKSPSAASWRENAIASSYSAPSSATIFTDGPIRAIAATRANAFAGTITTSGISLTVQASANAAAVLPADATTSVRLSSVASRASTAKASSSLKVAVRSAAPRSGHQPLNAIHSSSRPRGCQRRAAVDGGLGSGCDVAPDRQPVPIAPDRMVGFRRRTRVGRTRFAATRERGRANSRVERRRP